MPKEAASKILVSSDTSHPDGKLGEKYEKLQQVYRNVCLERDLLRKALKFYAAHLRGEIDIG